MVGSESVARGQRREEPVEAQGYRVRCVYAGSASRSLRGTVTTRRGHALAWRSGSEMQHVQTVAPGMSYCDRERLAASRGKGAEPHEQAADRETCSGAAAAAAAAAGRSRDDGQVGPSLAV